MLYKFQNDGNKNSKWLLTEVNYKMCQNLITAKTVTQCRSLKARNGIINAYVAMAKVQTTTKCNVMQRIEHTGTKKGSAKTG